MTNKLKGLAFFVTVMLCPILCGGLLPIAVAAWQGVEVNVWHMTGFLVYTFLWCITWSWMQEKGWHNYI